MPTGLSPGRIGSSGESNGDAGFDVFAGSITVTHGHDFELKVESRGLASGERGLCVGGVDGNVR